MANRKFKKREYILTFSFRKPDGEIFTQTSGFVFLKTAMKKAESYSSIQADHVRVELKSIADGSNVYEFSGGEIKK